MKKFLPVFLSLTIFLSAAVVPVDRARKVAENYYMNYAPSAEKGSTVQKVLTKEYMEQPTWYVVQFTKGWVIVAADDAVRPILGYSFDGKITEDLSNMQNPFVHRFGYYDRQIVHNVREKGYADEKSKQEWKDIENKVFPKDSKAIVVPALLLTQWGQGWPWNEMCPADSTGTKCPVGPVAISMAQIMRYHLYPSSGSGSFSYADSSGEITGTHSADFSNTFYNWSLMTPFTSDQVTTEDQENELAELAYHCGVAVETDFETDGSSAYLIDANYALKTNFEFGYDATYSSIGTVTDPTAFSSLIRSNLNNSQPLIWGGSGVQGGHAFILDGYTDDYYYHFNWGWEGSYNGWFQLNSLTPDSMDYTYAQSCVYNLICAPGPYPPSPHIESCQVTNIENVSITWTYDSSSLTVLYFEIFRNNEFLVQVPDSVQTYTDYNLSAGSYIYKVRAVYEFYGSPYESSFSDSRNIDIVQNDIYPVPKYFDTSLEPYNRQHIDLSWTKPFVGITVWDEGFEYGIEDWTFKRTLDYPPTGRKVNVIRDNFTQSDVTDGWFQCDEASFGYPQYIHGGSYSMAIGYTAPDHSWAIGPEITLPEGCELRYWHWITGNSYSGWLTTSYVNTYSGDFSESDPSVNLNQIAEYVDIDETTENLYDTENVIPLPAGTYRLCWIYKYTDGFQMAVDDILVGTIAPVKNIKHNRYLNSEKIDRIPEPFSIIDTVFPPKSRVIVLETDSLTGYEIYRNGNLASMINNPDSFAWSDTDFNDGLNEYFVRAIYATGTSIPSNRSSEIMDANPKPGYLEAHYDGFYNVDLSWFAPYHAPEHWFGYLDEEFEDYFDNVSGMEGTWATRRTIFTASELGLVYPITIDSVRAAFYDDGSAWSQNTFTFEIITTNYAGTADSVLVVSPVLEAVSEQWTKYMFDRQYTLDWGWSVLLHVADDGTPSSLVNRVDGGSHSQVYYGGDDTYDAGWYDITFGSSKGEWAILCYGQGTAPVITKNPDQEKLIMSPSGVLTETPDTSEFIPVTNTTTGGIPKGLLGYKIYRDDKEIGTSVLTSYTDVIGKDLVDVDYHVTAFYENPTGESAPSNVVTVTITSIEDNVPCETALSQNYPNPFNPETNIKFTIASDTKVSLKIFNTSGQLVAVPVDRFMNRGSYNINMNASKLSGGVYIYKLEANGKELSKKMTIIK